MPDTLVIWRLTDGKPGHMQQTLGLARALSALTPCEVLDIDVAAQPAGLVDFLRGRFTAGITRKRPQLILGAGHDTHFAMLAARRAVGGRVVALMKPSLPVFLFDFIVAPEHDGLQAGPRTINTRGVLNPMRPGEKKPDSLLFLIGGSSKHVQWDDAAILQQMASVIAGLKGGTVWRVTDSRRTPDSLRTELQKRYGERFQSFQECPPGWLAERLAVTETVWVSEDSVSMVYEALTAACQVGLFRLPRTAKNSRVMKGIEKLIAMQWVTSFEQWSGLQELRPARSFNEADRVARLLLEQLDHSF